MKKQEDKFTKRRLRASYLTSVISITLVLFLLGFFGLIVLHAKKISTHVRENIQLDVYIKDMVNGNKVNESEIFRTKKLLEATPGVKSTKYISPEEGAAVHKSIYGEDFISFLDGSNPIPACLEVHLNEDYANVDSLTNIASRIQKNEIVEDVQFYKDYVQAINDNIAKISFFFLLFSALLLLIATVLINNTIRLSVYANRFLIRTMDLIGATQGFIRKPFIIRGIVQGLIGSFISIGLLVLFLVKLQPYAKEIISIDNIDLYAILFALIIVIGIIISWWSSYFAVRKYLKTKLDNLYLQ